MINNTLFGISFWDKKFEMCSITDKEEVKYWVSSEVILFKVIFIIKRVVIRYLYYFKVCKYSEKNKKF